MLCLFVVIAFIVYVIKSRILKFFAPLSNT